ncbi:MAG: cyclase family protein [Candidatus Omnitrophota bacterium]
MEFLSHVISEETPLYGGKKGLSFKKIKKIDAGDSCNQMCWTMGNHAGTHVDAPRHFISRGKTIDQVDAAGWFFQKISLSVIPAVKPGQLIGPEDLKGLRGDPEMLLIKTGFERFRNKDIYWKSSPGLHPDLAGWLKKECPGISAIGMDIISVSSLCDRELGRKAHREFLRRGILLVEDMKLVNLRKAPVKVVVAPLRVKEGDASPCSVFAWSRS